MVQKKGYRTSEFWTALAAAAVPLLNQAFGWHLNAETIIGIVGPLALYVVSRGIAKSGTTTGP